ncbi:MAG: class I SAM-dependent methyltransferase [Deltaproteobacteria bacterium]|nr:class I SAM-dependent methyltransferase [Deltaproteobacteria bacterium]
MKPLLKKICVRLLGCSDILAEKQRLQDKEAELQARETALLEQIKDVKNIRAAIRSIYLFDITNGRTEIEGGLETFLSPPIVSAQANQDDIRTIERVQGHVHRWELEQLYDLAGKTSGNILELGSFHGKSTLALLLGSKYRKNKVYAVDPFIDTNDQRWGYTLVNGEQDCQKFIENTTPWNDRLTFYRMKSVEVAWSNGPIDLLFIDAFHTYDDVKADFNHFFPHLSEEAIVVFHDYSVYQPLFHGVARFVNELLDSGRWLWEDFRGAMITLKRVGPKIDQAEVATRNRYLRNLHHSFMDHLVNNKRKLAKAVNGHGLILKGPFKQAGQNMWLAYLPHLANLADTEDDLICTSPLTLFENGQELGPPHMLHDEIRQKGGGAYSHWGEWLYFSSSDNSDPNRNGRTYWTLIKVTS